MLFLPTYTAIAWYHKRLPSDLQSGTLEHAVAESEQFALGDYTHALMQGDRISDAERRDVAAKLARLTGLSPAYIEQTNLRVHIDRFDKELLRDQRRTVGRLDGRFIGIDKDSAGENNEFDPSYAAIFGEYTAVVNDYVRRELKFETDLPYEILTGKVRPWNYDRAQNRYVDVAETLRGAMAQNPYHEGLRRQRLLRPGHALRRHALHLRPHAARPRAAQERVDGLLRDRPHGLHRPQSAGAAEEGRGRVHPRERERAVG